VEFLHLARDSLEKKIVLNFVVKFRSSSMAHIFLCLEQTSAFYEDVFSF
jgi:hypothetical protein